jgi:hypothetical protein
MAIKSGETTYHQAKRGIVQNGLVLNLDAAVDASYSGGTTWRDLSFLSNNASLVNTPTLNKEKGGNFTLDGTNQYISVADNNSIEGMSALSLSLWFYADKAHGTGGTNFGAVLIRKTNSFSFSFNNNNNFITGAYIHNGSSWSGFMSGPLVSVSTWANLVFTYDGSICKFYKDGTLTGSPTPSVTGSIGTNTNNLTIGTVGGANGYELQGAIANTQMYNRALTATEVLQNYNVTRHRFGV